MGDEPSTSRTMSEQGGDGLREQVKHESEDCGTQCCLLQFSEHSCERKQGSRVYCSDIIHIVILKMVL
jgi:hypothetical protein